MNEVILTQREAQLEALIIQGMCHKEIAPIMGIALASVKVFTSRLLHKRDVHSMHELTSRVLWARIHEMEARLGSNNVSEHSSRVG